MKFKEIEYSNFINSNNTFIVNNYNQNLIKINLQEILILNVTKTKEINTINCLLCNPIIIGTIIIGAVLIITMTFVCYFFIIPCIRRRCKKIPRRITTSVISLTKAEEFEETFINQRESYTNLECIVSNYNYFNNYTTNRDYAFKERSFINIENYDSSKSLSKSDENNLTDDSGVYYMHRNHTIAISANAPTIKQINKSLIKLCYNGMRKSKEIIEEEIKSNKNKELDKINDINQKIDNISSYNSNSDDNLNNSDTIKFTKHVSFTEL